MGGWAFRHKAKRCSSSVNNRLLLPLFSAQITVSFYPLLRLFCRFLQIQVPGPGLLASRPKGVQDPHLRVPPFRPLGRKGAPLRAQGATGSSYAPFTLLLRYFYALLASFGLPFTLSFALLPVRRRQREAWRPPGLLITLLLPLITPFYL